MNGRRLGEILGYITVTVLVVMFLAVLTALFLRLMVAIWP